MVKSLPVWAVCIAHFTNNWGYYTLLMCLPTYLKNILHFDMKSVSLIADRSCAGQITVLAQAQELSQLYGGHDIFAGKLCIKN